MESYFSKTVGQKPASYHKSSIFDKFLKYSCLWLIISVVYMIFINILIKIMYTTKVLTFFFSTTNVLHKNVK